MGGGEKRSIQRLRNVSFQQTLVYERGEQVDERVVVEAGREPVGGDPLAAVDEGGVERRGLLFQGLEAGSAFFELEMPVSGTYANPYRQVRPPQGDLSTPTVQAIPRPRYSEFVPPVPSVESRARARSNTRCREVVVFSMPFRTASPLLRSGSARDAFPFSR